jgi:hypothetical protein
VSCTSSYSVSNSSRNALFSVAGKEAIKADRDRSVAWSFGACAVMVISMHHHLVGRMAHPRRHQSHI